MTSNIGSEHFTASKKPIGFIDTHLPSDDSFTTISRDVIKRVRETLPSELFNRISEVIVFKPLDQTIVYTIIDTHFRKLATRVFATHQLTLLLTEEAKEFFLIHGYDAELGARPLQRAMERHILDELALLLIQATIRKGDTIEITAASDQSTLLFTKKQNSL